MAKKAGNGLKRRTTSGSVLVVDDEADLSALIEDILEASGYQVETALDGAAALERLERDHFDLILSDVHMPGLDGMALYRELEHRRPELTQRMLFMTGNILDEDAASSSRRPAHPACGSRSCRKTFTASSSRCSRPRRPDRPGAGPSPPPREPLPSAALHWPHAVAGPRASLGARRSRRHGVPRRALRVAGQEHGGGGLVLPDQEHEGGGAALVVQPLLRLRRGQLTFYAPLSAQNAVLWAKRTPPGFLFSVKAYALLTGHHLDAGRLPPPLAALLPAAARPNARGQLDNGGLRRGRARMGFRRVPRGLQPLADAGKLGYVLFQMAPWVQYGPRRSSISRGCPRVCPG